MEIDTLITGPFDDWLSNELSTEAIRTIEAGKSSSFTWTKIEESGFADALVPEREGGAGVSLLTAGELIYICGKHALPFPLGTTIFARGVMAARAGVIPSGSITMARATKLGSGALMCRDVPFALVSDWVLAIHDDGAILLPRQHGQTTGSGIHGSMLADVEWAMVPIEAVPLPNYDWLSVGAAIYSALIAGGARRIMELSLQYAHDRIQFAKPIAGFQAVQQQLAVLAEQVFAVRISAQQAFYGHAIDPIRSAIAKSRGSRAVPEINAIGHMVHGAIGITEECELQLHTRRLMEWRQSFDGERYWDEKIGSNLLSTDQSTLQFLISTIKSV